MYFRFNFWLVEAEYGMLTIYVPHRRSLFQDTTQCTIIRAVDRPFVDLHSPFLVAQYSCARMLELAVVVGLARVMPRFQNCSKSHDRDVVVYFNYSEQRV
jgi:hypothetical protein